MKLLQKIGAPTRLLALALAMSLLVACEAATSDEEPVDSTTESTTGESGVSTTAPTEATTVAPDDAEVIPLVKVALTGQATSLDPAGPAVRTDHVAAALVSGALYRYDLNKQPQFDLLESEEVSDDGLTITQTLKPDLLYSDGTPVRADDAVLAVERGRDSVHSFFFQNVESIEAPDDRTIIWHLSAPTPELRNTLSESQFKLHPRELVEADERYFEHPVSAGPYMIEEWTPGTDLMRLAANPNYWGTPKIERIELTTIPDVTSQVLQLGTGAIEFVLDLPTATVSSLPPNVRVVPIGLGGVQYVTMNTSLDGPLSDPLVRQAMSLAINRQEVSDRAFAGFGAPVCAFIYAAAPEHECMLPNDGEQDLDAARALLAQTPYADGFSTELQVWARPGWADAGLVMAENLAEIGIAVEVTPVEDAVGIEHLQSGEYELMFHGGNGTGFGLTQILFGEGSSFSGFARYSDPEVDALLAEMAVELDPDRRRELLTEISLKAYENIPHIPVIERELVTGSILPEGVLEPVNPGPWLRASLVEEG